MPKTYRCRELVTNVSQIVVQQATGTLTVVPSELESLLNGQHQASTTHTNQSAYLGCLGDSAIDDLIELLVEILGDKLRQQLARGRDLLRRLQDRRAARCDRANLRLRYQKDEKVNRKERGLPGDPRGGTAER